MSGTALTGRRPKWYGVQLDFSHVIELNRIRVSAVDLCLSPQIVFQQMQLKIVVSPLPLGGHSVLENKLWGKQVITAALGQGLSQ